jgi:DNA-binding Xre family transcriptional regulator
MTTSIRAIRKQRGLTLQQLADTVGTTPQTIQRLETGNMSVSVDWLERIAGALSLEPADLLMTGPRGHRVPLLGHVTADGGVRVALAAMTATKVAGGFADEANGADTAPPHITIDGPTGQCVAISVAAPVGHYAEGTILVARRQDRARAVPHDCDCLIGLESGEMVLRRVGQAPDGELTFTAYDASADGIVFACVAWIAPVYMVVREI